MDVDVEHHAGREKPQWHYDYKIELLKSFSYANTLGKFGRGLGYAV
jgi:hypothetical protein